jgi:hypothetical protein
MSAQGCPSPELDIRSLRQSSRTWSFPWENCFGDGVSSSPMTQDHSKACDITLAEDAYCGGCFEHEPVPAPSGCHEALLVTQSNRSQTVPEGARQFWAVVGFHYRSSRFEPDRVVQPAHCARMYPNGTSAAQNDRRAAVKVLTSGSDRTTTAGHWKDHIRETIHRERASAWYGRGEARRRAAGSDAGKEWRYDARGCQSRPQRRDGLMVERFVRTAWVRPGAVFSRWNMRCWGLRSSYSVYSGRLDWLVCRASTRPAQPGYGRFIWRAPSRGSWIAILAIHIRTQQKKSDGVGPRMWKIGSCGETARHDDCGIACTACF